MLLIVETVCYYSDIASP